MNKYAAEKIAQEYYALGAQLALTKQANFARGFHKAQNALLATLGGGVTAGLSVPQLKALLSKSDRLGESFAKGDHIQNLNKLLGEHKSDLKTILEGKGGWVTHSETPELARAAIAKATQQLENAGTLSTADQIINAMPGALGIGAGLGVGTGIYKGLGKLDKKLKLY